MPPLQMLIKPASGMCNLRCSYCFYHDETTNRTQENYGLMSLETLECLVEKALSYADGSCGFFFQGGEPTLAGLDFYRELVRLQKIYNRKGLAISNSIQTNGWQMGEAWAAFLSEHHFLAGLSIDGVKAVHDKCRCTAGGRETFREVMATAALFDRYHVDYNVLTVVNRWTAGKTGRIYEFYKKNNFNYLQFIACLDPLGEEPGQREYSLTPEAYGSFLTQLFELWYLDYTKGCQPYIRQFENYIGILAGVPPEACDQRGVCSVQHVVEADGSVYPCDFYVLDPWKMGNIRENSFDELAAAQAAKDFVGRSLNPPSGCKGCSYYPLCRGGCYRHRTGSGENYFCLSYRMFFKAALPKMEKIAGDAYFPYPGADYF